MCDENGFFWAKSNKFFHYLFKSGSVFYHSIGDMMNRACLRRNRGSWVDKMHKGAIFKGVESCQLDDPIFIGSRSCCFGIVIDGSILLSHSKAFFQRRLLIDK